MSNTHAPASQPGKPHTPARQIRALPGKWVDLVHDGVPEDDLRVRGHDPAVWSALVSVAMSAANHGWTESMFLDLVLDSRRRLGHQAQLKNAKPRGRKQTIDLLDKAWMQAQGNVRANPTYSSTDLQSVALRRIQAAIESLEVQASNLTQAEHLVIDFILDRLRESASLELAISRQAFIDGTGLGKTAVGTAQRGLQAKCLLVQVERGVPSGPKASRRRASVWALPPVAADAHPEASRAHASNTGNRYVAPAPSSGAPLTWEKDEISEADTDADAGERQEKAAASQSGVLQELMVTVPVTISSDRLDDLLWILRSAKDPSRPQTCANRSTEGRQPWVTPPMMRRCRTAHGRSQ